MSLGLHAKRVFLTGASGFIGARLAECLTGAYGAEVHALVRRPGTVGVARLARLAGVRLYQGDVRNAEAVARASRGCSLFIHCATGAPGSRRERAAATVNGIRTVLEAAVRQPVERIVYFSSASVHDPARSGEVIREESPLNGAALAREKILAERLLAEYQRECGLPVVVVRPTCVWGPFSPIWTISAVELIRAQFPLLPLNGLGTSNLVHIDNLVDAVILTLSERAAVGQTFLINDDEPRTWGDLYGGYARFLQVPLQFFFESHGSGLMLKVSLYNAGLILGHVLLGKSPVARLPRDFYDHVPMAKALVSALPEAVRRRLQQSEMAQTIPRISGPPADSRVSFLPYNVLPRPILELYGSRSRYSNEKAKRVLGWRPRRSFDEAFAVTCLWLRYAGYAPSVASIS